jgi:hypothetical protein
MPKRGGQAGTKVEVECLSHGLISFRLCLGDGTKVSLNLTPDEAEGLAAMLYFNAHKQRLNLIESTPGGRYHA